MAALDDALANLETAAAQLTARLIELDAVPVDQRAKMTYSVGERTYGWNEYRASLDQSLTAKLEAIPKLRALTWGGQTITSVMR